MTSIVITAGIGMGLLFAGLLGGYVIAEQTYSPGNMMNDDPQATTQWMSTMMETMMNDPGLRQQMISQMIENPQFLKDVAQNNQMMNILKSDMMEQGMNEQDMNNVEDEKH